MGAWAAWGNVWCTGLALAPYRRTVGTLLFTALMGRVTGRVSLKVIGKRSVISKVEPNQKKHCEQASCLLQNRLAMSLCNNVNLPACLQSSLDCTLNCACAALYTFQHCARLIELLHMCESCIIARQPIKITEDLHPEEAGEGPLGLQAVEAKVGSLVPLQCV